MAGLGVQRESLQGTRQLDDLHLAFARFQLNPSSGALGGQDPFLAPKQQQQMIRTWSLERIPERRLLPSLRSSERLVFDPSLPNVVRPALCLVTGPRGCAIPGSSVLSFGGKGAPHPSTSSCLAI